MIRLSIKAMEEILEITEETLFLTRWFPNFFAEALIPINPHKWPSFIAGSAMASEMPNLIEKLDTTRQNLIVAKEYLASSKSDIQWRGRAHKLFQDTGTINFSCELGGSW